MLVLVLIVGVAFAVGFTKRRWLVFPVAAFLPMMVLRLTGAFDDGEGVGTYLYGSFVFTCLAGIGLLLSLGVQRLGNQDLLPLGD